MSKNKVIRLHGDEDKSIDKYYQKHKKEIGTSKTAFLKAIMIDNFRRLEQGITSIEKIKEDNVKEIAKKVLKRVKKSNSEQKPVKVGLPFFGLSETITRRSVLFIGKVSKELEEEKVNITVTSISDDTMEISLSKTQRSKYAK